MMLRVSIILLERNVGWPSSRGYRGSHTCVHETTYSTDMARACLYIPLTRRSRKPATVTPRCAPALASSVIPGKLASTASLSPELGTPGG